MHQHGLGKWVISSQIKLLVAGLDEMGVACLLLIFICFYFMHMLVLLASVLV